MCRGDVFFACDFASGSSLLASEAFFNVSNMFFMELSSSLLDFRTCLRVIVSDTGA